MRYPETIRKLISLFMRVHGVGKKTAERLVFNLLAHWGTKTLSELESLLSSLQTTVQRCETCGSLVEETECPFCTKERLLGHPLCVVAFSKDAYLIESTEAHEGGYFVLGALLSPLDGRGISETTKKQLLDLVRAHKIQEVLLALDSSLEGEATAHYIKELLHGEGILVTRLASGMPMGAQLDLVDRGTLSEALKGRQKF